MTEDRVPTPEAGRDFYERMRRGLEAIRDTSSDPKSRQLAESMLAAAAAQPAPPLDVRRQVVEQIRREFRRPENMLTSFKAYTPEPQGFMKAYVAEAVDRILDEVARDD